MAPPLQLQGNLSTGHLGEDQVHDYQIGSLLRRRRNASLTGLGQCYFMA